MSKTKVELVVCTECGNLQDSTPPESNWGEEWRYHCPETISHFGKKEAVRPKRCKHFIKKIEKAE